MYLFSTAGRTLTFERDASNNIVVTGRSTGNGSAIITLTSDTTYTDSDTWLGVLASWDIPNSKGYLYVNRSSDLGSSSFTSTVGIDLDVAGYYFGGDPNYTNWVGDVHDFYFWDDYIDISDSDEIVKLISSDGVTDYANPGPTAGTPKPVGIQMWGPPFYKPPIVAFCGAFTDNKGIAGHGSWVGSFDWIDTDDDDVQTYRQTGARNARLGERSFDSERTGWTYARHDTFIERREGLSDFGKRLGIAERKARTRQERPGHENTFSRLIWGSEDDSEDRR